MGKWNCVLVSCLLAFAVQMSAHAATYTVTTTADAGPGSLRDAMAAANASLGVDDVIVFNIPPTDPGCSAPNHCTIVLHSFLGEITDNLTIDGSAQSIAIDGSGGGVFGVNLARLTINALTITNAADSAILVSEGSAVVTNSTFLHNSGCVGGAIYVGFGGLTVLNSTFVGNSATGQGFCSSGAGGGAIFVAEDLGLIVNSTFSGNSSATANSGGTINGGVGGDWDPHIINITIQNSILAGSPGGNCPTTARIIDGGGNLDDDSSCAFTVSSSLNGRNPRLGPLQDNGGSTPTMALQKFSPAIDAATDSVLGPPDNLAYDQRGPGFPRKMGAHVDVGAYESVPQNIIIPFPVAFCPLALCKLVPVRFPRSPCLTHPFDSNCVPVACCGAIDPGFVDLAQVNVFLSRMAGARVVKTIGVQIQRARTPTFVALKSGTVIQPGDLLRLHSKSQLEISGDGIAIRTPENGVPDLGSKNAAWYMLATHKEGQIRSN